MPHKVMIDLPDDVYEGLRRQVDDEHISQFIEDLLRPLVIENDDLVQAYRDMAAELVREQEALEWIESGLDDSLE